MFLHSRFWGHFLCRHTTDTVLFNAQPIQGSPTLQSWHITLPKSHGTQSFSFFPDPLNLSHMQKSRSVLLGPSKCLLFANTDCRHHSFQCTAVTEHNATKITLNADPYPPPPNFRHMHQTTLFYYAPQIAHFCTH